jgi:hypothetical protein
MIRPTDKRPGGSGRGGGGRPPRVKQGGGSSGGGGKKGCLSVIAVPATLTLALSLLAAGIVR